MIKRVVIQRVGGYSVLMFDTEAERDNSLDMVKRIKSPYTGINLRFDRDGEKKLFVSATGASSELTIYDYKAIGKAFITAEYELTDKSGIIRGFLS